jgi:glutamate carboxypeptidase
MFMKRDLTAPPSLAFDMSQLLAQACHHESRMVNRMRALVEHESPSGDKEAVDKVARLFAEWARNSGGNIRWHRHRRHGDSLEVRFGEDYRRGRPVMVLGHLDTVWDHRTITHMPWKVTRERIAGPGVLDMKAGVAMALAAVEIVQSLHLLRQPVTLLLHGDEEIGSPASRRVTESVARRCNAVYVLEPAQGEAGAYKTARKGTGGYRLVVHGVAAHSGVDFERGHSAVAELAWQIETIRAFNDPRRGITVNPGVIGGGTRSNVVAAEAWVEIDIRIARAKDAARVDRAFSGLKPRDKFCRLDLRGGLNRLPMERTPGTIALFRRAQRLGAQIGVELDEAATGGASDGNFTSALGVPTLDGMGAVGAGAHAVHEHLLRKHLAPRTALLAAMLIS